MEVLWYAHTAHNLRRQPEILNHMVASYQQNSFDEVIANDRFALGVFSE